MAYPTKSAGSGKRLKPKKPFKDFPLFPHANGQWAKKIKGKLYYFGLWEEPDAALKRWQDHLAGRTRVEDITVKGLCNAFMTDRKHRLDAGDIVQRSYRDYYDTCERLLRHLDGNKQVDDLRPEDFTELRAKYAKDWAPGTVGNEVQRVRVIFNFAYESSLVDRPVRFGPTFKKPSKKVMRKARNEKGPRMFEAVDLRRIIDSATNPMKAMVLLGINCGFGNADCANLPTAAIDLVGGWIEFPRPKTGINRRCPLWPETIDALRDAFANRKTPKDESNNGLAFITKYGGPWSVADSRRNPISAEFRKLIMSMDLYRPGLSFYALRHMFETFGGESRDQVAVDHIMGHVDNSMAATYRERISDERLTAVTQHVRKWLYGKGVK